MMMLLAQRLPGYTDVREPGGVSPMFSRFYAMFVPNITDLSLGRVISRLVLFIIVIAGVIFFLRLLSAGFGFLTSTGDPNKVQGATKEITHAFIGLLVVISSFFLLQIIQVVFGVSII